MINKQKILESGLLELYIMGSLDNADIQVVEKAIKLYPELKTELYQIEKTLYLLAKSNAVSPSLTLKEEILLKIKNLKSADSTKSNKVASKGYTLIIPLILLSLSTLSLIYAYFSSSKNYQNLENRYNKYKIACDSLAKNNASNQELLANLSSPNNKVLNVEPTEGYPDTRLIIHHNRNLKKNYLQLDDLPTIADDQSFQLWSLKDGADPIPLDVFQGDQNLIEVKYIEGTNAYAITIEPLGGQSTPTLAKLIGVIAVGS